MSFVCVYILKNQIKKKIQDFQNFPKKREKFSKKKKNFWTRDIGLPSDFFKKDPFFSFKDFKILKTLLFKMVHEDPLDKTFSKLWCLKA